MSRASLSLQLHAIVALGGDANLDGIVDVSDLGLLATTWQSSGDWQQGDFNGDDVIDVSDLGILASNWQAGIEAPPLGPALDEAMAALGLGGISVPEPTTLALSCLLVAPMVCRRRARD